MRSPHSRHEQQRNQWVGHVHGGALQHVGGLVVEAGAGAACQREQRRVTEGSDGQVQTRTHDDHPGIEDDRKPDPFAAPHECVDEHEVEHAESSADTNPTVTCTKRGLAISTGSKPPTWA